MKIVETSDHTEFENQVKGYLSQGYKISSTNCGFVNSEKYDFCSIYQAILIKPEHSINN